MDKAKLLEVISQALDGMGMDDGMTDMYDESGLLPNNEVPVWSKLDVSVDDEGRGPIHSKDSLFKALQQIGKPVQIDAYGMPYDDDQEELMLASGMV
jgi:hypothetical protein